ncbi:fumarylacetoacetate hydrolase family protein [Novosphingobium pentaromativorans]|nr:fumarylacetoacetate hydrolase family protein [Novosphingobium pentaromativorans]AIT81831.1 hypothetical protein JI59_19750 [Novosphingobium pentaromativorans US6-1]
MAGMAPNVTHLGKGDGVGLTVGYGPDNTHARGPLMSETTWCNRFKTVENRSSDMIFNVAALISYITEWITLKPGDIIASGTMGGFSFARAPPIFMKPGALAEVEISKIGVLVNGIVDEV